MRRRHLLPEALILVLLVLWGWLLVANLLRSKSRLGAPTKVSFVRVKEGMTAKEVAAILGPPERHRSFYYSDYDHGPIDRLQWVEQEAIFTVYLDDEGKVGSKDYRPVAPEPESLRDRLHRWLPWCGRALGSSWAFGLAVPWWSRTRAADAAH